MGSGCAEDAVLAGGYPLDGYSISWLEVMTVEEVPPGTAAAEDPFVRCDVGSYRAGKAFEVEDEQCACPVSRVGAPIASAGKKPGPSPGSHGLEARGRAAGRGGPGARLRGPSGADSGPALATILQESRFNYCLKDYS
jgi:hypothetical protein